MSSWPGTLPQKPRTKSWSGGPQNNLLGFQPEVGPPISRRRSSAVAHAYSGTFPALTATQVATFETFFSDTLNDGADSFTWDDPISGTNYSWKFSPTNAPYSINHTGVDGSGVDRFDLQVTLIRLPQ